MPFKYKKDRRKWAREYTMRKRRERGIKARVLMPLVQRIEHQKIASRKHYYSHLEQERERTKQWKMENPEKQRFMEKRRRARELNAEGSHTLLEWQQLKNIFGNLCVWCQKKIKLTEDHIIPLSKCGSDNIENIQPLCFSCNSSKQDKIENRLETYLLRFEND